MPHSVPDIPTQTMVKNVTICRKRMSNLPVATAIRRKKVIAQVSSRHTHTHINTLVDAECAGKLSPLRRVNRSLLLHFPSCHTHTHTLLLPAPLANGGKVTESAFMILRKPPIIAHSVGCWPKRAVPSVAKNVSVWLRGTVVLSGGKYDEVRSRKCLVRWRM